MAPMRRNTQLYAHRDPLLPALTVAGRSYRIVRVFKHDFYAATCLYESPEAGPTPQIVVKLYRTQVFCGLEMQWAGRFLRNRERAIYAALEGLPGVPRWVGEVGPTGLAVEYIDGVTLDRTRAHTMLSEGSYAWGGEFNTHWWNDPAEELFGLVMTQVRPYGHLDLRADFQTVVTGAIDD